MGQVSPVTTSFMRALPAALRPNPYNIDESVMLAVGNGWDIHDLARLCWVNERNPTPAFVVTNLRNLAASPPERVPRRRVWVYGHVKCTDPLHPVGCEICRCVPGEAQHVVSREKPT